jgi:thiamine biosynthesis lipoprotein
VPAEHTTTRDAIAIDEDEVVGTVTAMTASITVRVTRAPRGDGPADADELTALRTAVASALLTFVDVERTCSRFDPTSALSHANAAPARWHVVPDLLFAAVAESHVAYRRTAGRFDPRVLTTLVALGYGSSLAFGSGGVTTAARSVVPPAGSPPPWHFRQRPRRRALHLGGSAIDLGGIGKGLAVRWASARLSRVTSNFLVEAGGDCYCAGAAPGGEPWLIGVEDPARPSEPVVVLALTDRAVATSSTRLRRWRAGDEMVHHLIDPATGRPGGSGLRAVTVVARDPAWAEVWSKVLFLEGPGRIADAARRHGVDALWIHDDGEVAMSASLGPAVTWRAS